MFFNKQRGKKPPEHMSKDELDKCYLPENWANYSFSERLSILQETENRFAASQYRPAKELKPEHFNDSTLGKWSRSRNSIRINSSMLSDGVIETGAGIKKEPTHPFFCTIPWRMRVITHTKAMRWKILIYIIIQSSLRNGA